MKALYFHESQSQSTCTCAPSFVEQFPTPNSFTSYVQKVRRQLVRSEGWRRTKIRTSSGMNTTGVYREVLPLIANQVKIAGGLGAVLPYCEEQHNGVRHYSKPTNSDSIRDHFDAMKTDAPLIFIDLYADGTTLAKSGSQTVCVVRARLANVSSRSNIWMDIGIAPVHSLSTTYADPRLSSERSELFQRFLFVALQDIIKASKYGFMLLNKLHYVRINTLVCDQKMERHFVSLKSAGSYRDCTLCTLPNRIYTSNSRVDIDVEENNAVQQNEIFENQFTPGGGPPRSVIEVVSRQIIVSRHSYGFFTEVAGPPKELLRKCKEFLVRNSASNLPPALASVHGFGSPPYSLYRAIGLDKLHTIDLGLERELTDKAFHVVNSPSYNSGMLSKMALVRIANQRYRDLPRACTPTSLSPFRSSDSEKHANMTGVLRRQITPMVWVVLNGLQLLARPDDDAILAGALYLNAFQFHFHCINMKKGSENRSLEQIKEIQRLAFESGLYLTQALGLNLSTKAHRMMHHVTDALTNYGCSRRGNSDANETLHKNAKRCYRSTNQHHIKLAEQLLQIRSIADACLTYDGEYLDVLHGESENSQSFETLFTNAVMLNTFIPGGPNESNIGE